MTTTRDDVSLIADLILGGDVVVLSGAGLSTESGIPDYRGATGATARKYTPMTYQTFLNDAVARRRYWARSHLGWGFIRDAEPNDGHYAVAKLERAGLVHGVITQNVDALHEKAGSQNVIDLHGRLDRVICLSCSATSPRRDLDAKLHAANLSWDAEIRAINPDGDVDIADDTLDSFVVVDCELCGGLLKPDVVYFGENVPKDRVEQAYALSGRAALLLVLGSTLTVFSGRRFVQRAADEGKLIVIVNEGETRADDIAYVKVSAPLGATLNAVAAVVDA